jgi:RNA polymerase sigma factor (TIGR02999 family)
VEELSVHVVAVYEELRRLAHQQLRGESSNHTLSTTALVHEAFLRLNNDHSLKWNGRAHFFGIAARVMRRILVDYARARKAAKRSLPDLALLPSPAGTAGIDLAGVLDLDRALDQLEKKDPRQARIVELRYFAGLSIEETGLVLTLSPSTVKNEWAMARAWLYRRIQQGPPLDARP